MTILDKRLLWLGPYLKAIHRDVNFSKLVAIKGYYVFNKQTLQEGQTICQGRKYTITLKLNRGNLDEPQFIYEILHTLAHEVAHLKFFQHSPDHLKLTAKLFNKFGTVLKKEGVTNTYKRIEING
jgi:hypothetical protein